MDQQVRVIGVPMDLGADRRGVDMGPSAIRYAGLAAQLEAIGIRCTDHGDVSVLRPEESDPTAGEPGEGRAKFLAETKLVCERVASAVESTRESGQFPLVLGGDHSIAIGSVGGAASDEDVGIVWFDAHGDFNTPTTSPSGNVHGMPLAAAIGVGEFADMGWATAPRLSEENVVLVGLRNPDQPEREFLRDSDVTVFTMRDIDEMGITEVTSDALDAATDGVEGIHVSLDLDWLDPNEAPGVGTPERGGVSYREAHAAMEIVAEYDARFSILRSMELVEVNPVLDEHNETAELATELAASALGKRIL